jgi:hypothetical protein
VSKTSSVIEIGGNQYDAVTGQLVGAVKKVTSHVSLPTGGAIDGFIKKSSPNRHSAQHVHQRPQRSQTLMRTIVKKPLQSTIEQASPIAQKARSGAASAARISKAKLISQSDKVRRFGGVAHSKTDQPTTKVRAEVRPHNAKPRPLASAAAVAPAMPSMVTSVSHQQLEQLLDNALARADAHKKLLESQRKGKSFRRFSFGPRWLSISSVVAAILLIGGFFAWQNVPQVSVKMAAMRAHVDASVPAYTPSGFSYASPVNYSSGAVTINFKAGSNNRTFAITQQSSNWSSSSLEANAVPADSQVQTSKINGTTVYIYGANNDATWVSRGVKYTLKDKANLNSDQILRIAGSM